MLLKDSGKKLAKEGTPFYLAIVSASRRFNSKAFKKLISAKAIRFATQEEVLEWTGCITGAVPPTGSLFPKPVPTFVDESLGKEAQINFNCGLRTHSMSISFTDYQKIEGFAKCENFTEE
jgi:prolyl-tRNA editing enzyme YbaK/EbsC (Cys-tRNA(Pro) deacylase)